MDRDRLPLPTLLSHVLVAMTIGLDNELEQRMPHRTALGRQRGVAGRGPWLVSWATWANLLRFVPPAGISTGELLRLSHAPTSAVTGKNPGIVRWGYVRRDGDVVRPTPAFLRASTDVFPRLPAIVEARWSDHLGAEVVAELRAVVGELLGGVDRRLPHYLPQADDLLWTRWEAAGPRVEEIEGLALVDRLAQVLLLYALEHEGLSAVPLTMAANLLRVVDVDGTTTRDVLRRSGVSREAMGFLTGWRQQPRLTVEVAPRTIGLTPEGAEARRQCEALAVWVEQSWGLRWGSDLVSRLRAVLEQIVVAPTLDRSPLAALVEPPADGWRAWVPRPVTLPHYPMILHRGGYPDGA